MASAISGALGSIIGKALSSAAQTASSAIKKSSSSGSSGSAATLSGSGGSSSKAASTGSTASALTGDAALSASDQAKIAEYKAQYNKAQANQDQQGMQAAHAAAEAVRNGNGYTGGNDGATYSALASTSAYTPKHKGNYTSSIGSGNTGLTSEEKAQILAKAKANSAAWHTATTQAEKDRIHDENVEYYSQVGYNYDATTGEWSPNQTESAVVDYATTSNDALEQYDLGLDAEQAAIDAAVEKYITSARAQQQKIQDAGVEGNKQAQAAYYQVMNPNGGLAESLAARGLLPSGYTESSIISAGNTYQNALNDNYIMVQEQLAEIENAILQARYDGDIQSAEALAAYYDKVAAQLQSNASQIAALRQWGTQYESDQAQQAWSNSMTQQQYDDQKKLIEQQYQQGQIDYATAQAQLQALELENKYSAYQLSQLGIS